MTFLCVQEHEGFHVHVGLTSDRRFVAITALSKASTEVHLLDSLRPDSAPQLVHERQPGALSPPSSGADLVCPASSSERPWQAAPPCRARYAVQDSCTGWRTRTSSC